MASQVMAIAGHVSRRMLERYSRTRTEAKRTERDAIAAPTGLHQNVYQPPERQSDPGAK
jgi:hypothetical protein